MARKPHVGSHLGSKHDDDRDEDDDDILTKAKPQTQSQSQAHDAPAKKGPAPVVGSMLHYHPGDNDPGPHPGDEQPLAAIVASVLSEDALNLMVIAADGATYGKQGVHFCRKGETPVGEYCDVPGHEAKPEEEDEDQPRPKRERAKELADQLSAFAIRMEQAKKNRAERKAQREGAKAEAAARPKSA